MLDGDALAVPKSDELGMTTDIEARPVHAALVSAVTLCRRCCPAAGHCLRITRCDFAGRRFYRHSGGACGPGGGWCAGRWGGALAWNHQGDGLGGTCDGGNGRGRLGVWDGCLKPPAASLSSFRAYTVRKG